jgi:hypothetical protein
MKVRLPDELVESARQSGVTIKMDFELKPGDYLLRLVVRDAAGEMSAENSAIEISLVGQGDLHPSHPTKS